MLPPGSASAAGGWTRRSLLRGAAAAVTVGAGAASLAACGLPGQKARTTAQHYKILLTFQPNGTLPFNKTTQELYQAALAPFYKANPGVGVKLEASAWGSNVQEILGGSGADVISDNNPPPYMSPSGNLLLKLDNLLTKDNIDRSIWSRGQLESYIEAAPDHGLYMLPGYFSPMIYAVRLSDFDTAGIERPNPKWTYTDFQQVCQTMSKQLPNGQRRYGCMMLWSSHSTLQGGTSLFHGWGDGVVTPEGLAAFSAPENIQAGNWAYEQLFWPGYAVTTDQMWPWYGTNFLINDQVVMQLSWDGLVLDNAQRFTNFQWDYYAAPIFPKGPTAFGTDDFYAIPASTKYPEQAWELLKFLSFDASPSGWQQQLIKIGLLQPCLNSLWDVWISTLRSVAPPLQDKNLEAFKDVAISGRAFPNSFFPFSDQQCEALTQPALVALWNQTTSVPVAFASLDQQINALLATVEKNAKGEEQTAAAIAAVTPGPTTTYPAPPTNGLGLPATPATSFVVQDGTAGTWTLLGVGSDMGGTQDSATFAALSTTATEGTWTCRLTQISNLSEVNASGQPQLSNWVKIGLAARGDLSDDAAEVYLALSASYGLQFLSRSAPGASTVDQHFLWPKDPSGVVEQVTSPPTTPVPNFVTRPVWMRLTRKGTTWTALVSLDGKNYQQMGHSTVAFGLGGAWVGLVACAHNADFNSQGYVRAVFDNVSFTPNTSVQLGTEGVPPAAGAVPSNWATMAAPTASAASSSSASK